ncbi:MAG: hypothetical protein HC903_19045 [Methylacidiphilales bacterium]|nr:hypothetical protein [Candidatus Methylacidiphilales bacterium]NJR17122.1 hypothetical protein [Calothrix sp. CSU_2_0]
MAFGNKTSAGSSSSGGSGSNYYNANGSKNVPKNWFRVLWFLILLSMVAIAFVNIKPYVDAANALGVTVVDQSFIKFISFIPIVNAIASGLGVGVVWVVGAALWATFQLIEVMPVILYNHPGFLQEVIQDAESQSKYGIKENDDPTVAGLKKAYNKLPVSFLENLSKIRLCAYVIDFCICFWRYSPVASGKITDFFYFVMTGQWQKINGTNLMLALITLFGVEIGLNLLLWVGKLAFTAKRASEPRK